MKDKHTIIGEIIKIDDDNKPFHNSRRILIESKYYQEIQDKIYPLRNFKEGDKVKITIQRV